MTDEQDDAPVKVCKRIGPFTLEHTADGITERARLAVVVTTHGLFLSVVVNHNQFSVRFKYNQRSLVESNEHV